VQAENRAAQQRVSTVAADVNQSGAEVTDDIVALLTDEIPELRDDRRVVDLLRASVAENVTTLLHVFEHEMDPWQVDAPAAAIAYARRLAQRGVPIVALVRAYRIGHARFMRWCYDALAATDGGAGTDADAQVRADAGRRMTELSFTYIDRMSEQVIEVYERERDRWLHNRATVRATRIRAVLAGEAVDIDAAETTIGYRVRQLNLGVVAWVDEPGHRDDDLLTVEHAVVDLAQHAGSASKPLFVPCDESAAWGWLPLGADPEAADHVVAAAVDSPVRLAVGSPGGGVDGFRRTHREALLAQTVALAAGARARPITAFADIRPIALMSSDLGALRDWVLETLGVLAADDDRHDRLRATLRAFLAAGGSYTATAELLTLHRNTVRYRVAQAEEMLGRPLAADRLGVELALLVADQLGATVLQPA
jgi:hypothetical protein